MILSSRHASAPATECFTPGRRSERVSSEETNSTEVHLNRSNIFSDECFICGKYRLQQSKQDKFPRKLVTKDGEISIKKAARDKMHSFYYENESVDLIARELKFHDSCYTTFTFGYSGKHQNSEPVVLLNDAQEVQQQGNYEAVKQHIKQHVLSEKGAVSMSVLHSIYGLHPQDRRYRLKLKDRIKKDFADQVLFLTIGSKNPEVIVDSSISPSEISFKDKEGCLINPLRTIISQKAILIFFFYFFSLDPK